jgi:GDP-L-fucose synthase
MVGSAILRALAAAGGRELIAPTREELDLLDQGAVFRFLAATRPRCVIAAAARVGGIHANDTRRAEFLYENLAIAANLIHGAHQAGVPRLLFLGSSCAYPRDCPQPIREEYLLTGPLEPTNEAYAVAKIAGIRLCDAYRHQHGRDYFSVMPTNLYGPGDNYDPESSHVMAALIRKTAEAVRGGRDEIVVWGSGAPRREFLHVDDLARACLFLLDRSPSSRPALTNVGYGEDITIRELAQLIGESAGFRGTLRFDASRPDGTPRKLLDSGRIRALGWSPLVGLREGIRRSLGEYLRGGADD